MQLSRMARAFKIWISIRYFGLDAFRATIDRTASPTPTWSGYPYPDPAELANLEAFAGTDESALEFLASACYEKHAEPGEHVVRRWGTDRDFYVILDGTVEVFVDTRIVRRLGPGDFFGELAAQDWGGGFGYPRPADVVATAPLRLLVVPLDDYPTVVALPGLRDRIRGAFRVRLPES